MSTGRNSCNDPVPPEESLPDAYRKLNSQRVDIDRRMTTLSSNDVARDELWQELESVLDQLREIVVTLADVPAADLPTLRVKAEVLETLLLPDDGHHGSVIPENQRSDLVLSLIEDIKRLIVP